MFDIERSWTQRTSLQARNKLIFAKVILLGFSVKATLNSKQIYGKRPCAYILAAVICLWCYLLIDFSPGYFTAYGRFRGTCVLLSLERRRAVLFLVQSGPHFNCLKMLLCKWYTRTQHISPLRGLTTLPTCGLRCSRKQTSWHRFLKAGIKRSLTVHKTEERFVQHNVEHLASSSCQYSIILVRFKSGFS